MSDEDQTQSVSFHPLAESTGRAEILVLTGPQAGARIVVSDSVTIGRSSSADLTLDEPSLSRVHARFTRGRGLEVVVEDLQSTNGVYVNDTLVSRKRVTSTDRVRLGNAITLKLLIETTTERQLKARNQLEAVGRLSGPIAHDMNNLLQCVLSNAYLAANADDDDVSRQQYLNDITQAASQGAALMKQLLGFSTNPEEDRDVHDISALTEGVVSLYRSLLSHGTIDCVCAPGVQVHCNRSQLHQLLLNLLVNAGDATRDAQAHIRVSLEEHSLDAPQASSWGLPPGRYGICTVSDNGEGIDASSQDHIFEPFFTTKPEHQGTGLGLAISANVVRQHGGAIRVESAAGEGATFRFALPISPPQAEPTSPQLQPRRCGPALVFESDALVQRSTLGLLAQAGFTPLAASTLHSVMRQLEDSSPPMTLLILDHDLLEDVELTLSQIAHRFPNLPVVLSGRSQPSERISQRWVPKPFSRQRLLHNVAELQQLTSLQTTLSQDTDPGAPNQPRA